VSGKVRPVLYYPTSKLTLRRLSRNFLAARSTTSPLAAPHQARKEQLVAKRQTKRETFVATPHPLDADVHGLPLNSPAVIRTASRPSGAQRFRTPEEAARADKGAQRMKMESRFLKLPLDLLQHHRLVSATEVLGRPIRQELGVLHVEELQPPELEELPRLTCPARPKWRYTQTKEEVEKNEGESLLLSLQLSYFG